MVKFKWRRKSLAKRLFGKAFLGLKIKIILILAVIIALEAGFYFLYLNNFNSRLLRFPIRQKLSFAYYVKMGINPHTTMYIGDLNGLNYNGMRAVSDLAQKQWPKDKSLVFIPSIMPDGHKPIKKELNQSEFYNRISVDGVVLVDNFCTGDWDNLKNKEIYSSGKITPGPSCADAPPARDLHHLIQRLNVGKVVLLYDIAPYKEFVSNFLTYLKENKIEYEFIQNKEVFKFLAR